MYLILGCWLLWPTQTAPVFSLWQPKESYGISGDDGTQYLLLGRTLCQQPNWKMQSSTSQHSDGGWRQIPDPNHPYLRFNQEVREGGDEWERQVAGVLQIQPDMGEVPPHWHVYFQVADVSASLQKALELGGEQIHPVIEMPKVKLVGIRDPQGAHFTLMQMDFKM